MHVNNAILLERKMESGYFQIIGRSRNYRVREHRARKTNAEVTTESRKVERDHGG